MFLTSVHVMGELAGRVLHRLVPEDRISLAALCLLVGTSFLRSKRGWTAFGISRISIHQQVCPLFKILGTVGKTYRADMLTFPGNIIVCFRLNAHIVHV